MPRFSLRVFSFSLSSFAVIAYVFLPLQIYDKNKYSPTYLHIFSNLYLFKTYHLLTSENPIYQNLEIKLIRILPKKLYCHNTIFNLILFFLFVIKFIIIHSSYFIIALFQQVFDTFDFYIKVFI